MKKLSTLFIMLFFAALAVSAQETKTVTDPKAPVITFKTDTYSFGTINQGDSVSFEFAFTNTGKTDLIIGDVKASCGCTTPYWPKEPIKPGKTSKINATFRSAGKEGEQNKMITITSNASEPTKRIFFKGKVNVPAK
jgi:hypothetical protein